MTEETSALFDGEVEAGVGRRQIERLVADDASSADWRTYALIGVAMRGSAQPTRDASSRFHERLAREATVLCPLSIKQTPPEPVSMPWAAVASIAGVALVAWAAYGMLGDHANDMATLDAFAASRVVAESGRQFGAEEFMLAHQSVSPSGAMSGFSHYARTVAHRSPEGLRGR